MGLVCSNNEAQRSRVRAVAGIYAITFDFNIISSIK